MGKKIIVFTSSARKRGNSNLMAAAFMDAARQKGHEIRHIDATKLKIGPCRACDGCYKTGKPCAFDDDFNQIAQEILEADGLVFAVPLYWYSMPACMKAVIDKMHCYSGGGKDVSGKECAMITCCAEKEMEVLDGIRFTFRRIAALKKWKYVGEVLLPGVLKQSDVEKTDGCRQAAALADRFFLDKEDRME